MRNRRLTLLEYLTGFNLRIDQLLVTDADSAGPQAPGRIPVATALSFLVFATAMLLVNMPGRFGWPRFSWRSSPRFATLGGVRSCSA